MAVSFIVIIMGYSIQCVDWINEAYGQQLCVCGGFLVSVRIAGVRAADEKGKGVCCMRQSGSDVITIPYSRCRFTGAETGS